MIYKSRETNGFMRNNTDGRTKAELDTTAVEMLNR